MKNINNNIANDFFNAYSTTEEFQKSLLLSMLTVFNKTNIDKCSEIKNQNPFDSSLYDINHISKEIANKLNNAHSSFTIQQCKIICDAVLSLSKLLDTINTLLLKPTIDEEINRIYNEISALNISRRTLTREEFLTVNLDDIDSDTFEAINYTPPERAQESKLKKYGYSVAWDNHLSTKKRQDLLRDLIESGKVSKGYVISYLKHNIQINGKKESNEFAVMKWKEDLDFIYKL